MQGRLRQRQMEAQHPKGKWDFERDQLPSNTHVTLRPLKGQWLEGGCPCISCCLGAVAEPLLHAVHLGLIVCSRGPYSEPSQNWDGSSLHIFHLGPGTLTCLGSVCQARGWRGPDSGCGEKQGGCQGEVEVQEQLGPSWAGHKPTWPLLFAPLPHPACTPNQMMEKGPNPTLAVYWGLGESPESPG